MTQNLDELKEKLYRAFDRAIEKSENWNVGEGAQANNAKAAASLAQAIVAVEARLEERDQGKSGLKLPGKGL